MYKVIYFFVDLTDNKHPYNVGDTFPRAGVEATPERIAYLAGSKNRHGFPLIAKVGEEKQVKQKLKGAKKKSCGCEVKFDD